MNNFLVRILLAAAVTLVAFVVAAPAPAQQADEDRTATSPRQQQPKTPPQSQQNAAQPPSSSDPQTQDALSFTGLVVKDKGQIVLKDPITKMSYQFDDESKAKQYVGKQVRVTGRLDMSSNTIHMDKIEALP
jgi:hemolysin activation/secretion protein